MKFSLVVLAVAAPLTASFTVEPAGVSKILTSRTSLDMVKGFGKEIEKTPQKIKSQAQMERERASSQYDKIASSGGQEYAIFVRQFGGDDKSWLPCGSIAVNRGEQVSSAIFVNEEPLRAAITRTYPKLKGFENEFEYGYNLKIYPDEPVEVAKKSNASTGPSLGNWISNLLSPIDTTNVQKS